VNLKGDENLQLPRPGFPMTMSWSFFCVQTLVLFFSESGNLIFQVPCKINSQTYYLVQLWGDSLFIHELDMLDNSFIIIDLVSWGK
jgi:hypothetical protein